MQSSTESVRFRAAEADGRWKSVETREALVQLNLVGFQLPCLSRIELWDMAGLHFQ